MSQLANAMGEVKIHVYIKLCSFCVNFKLVWFLVLVLCTAAQVVLAQIKVTKGFKPALPLACEIIARVFLASCRTVGKVPKPQRVSNKFQTLLEVAR